jgi:hypothetical protein
VSLRSKKRNSRYTKEIQVPRMVTTMMRLQLFVCLAVQVVIQKSNAFQPVTGGRRSLSIQRQQQQQQPYGLPSWVGSALNDDANASFHEDIGTGRFTDDEANVVVPVEPKKKAPKRKAKAAAAAAVAPPVDVTESVAAPTTTTQIPVTAAVPPAPAPAPATVPSKIYYRAKEDDELYAVSSISVDNQSVVTLKDLKKVLVEANEWYESSRVIFYRGEERLAFTTELQDCIMNNSADNPLFVAVLQASAAAAEAPIVQPQEGTLTDTSTIYVIHIPVSTG